MTIPDAPSYDRYERLQVIGQPLDTTEIRWFAAGEPPQEYVDWFSDHGQGAVVELRNDAYRIAGDASVGLKRRDHGPLELKRRQGISPLMALPGGFKGQIEEWCKTGLEEPLGDIGWKWGNVYKVVLTRTYSIDAWGSVFQLSGRKPVAPACDVELATVSVDDVTAWTFALEAWGPGDSRREVLEASLRAMLLDLPPIPIGFIANLSLNMGYPEWLAETVWDGIW